MTYTPSPEQIAYRSTLLDTTSSICLVAVAGSGKTTALVENLDAMPGSKALLAFNRKIADELNARVKTLSITTQMETNANTMHSFGLQALKASGNKAKVQGGKLRFMLKDMQAALTDNHPQKIGANIIVSLVSYAKNSGFDLTSDAERFPSSADPADWLQIAEHYGLIDELPEGFTPAELIKQGQRLFKESNRAATSMIDFDDMVFLPLLWGLPLKKYKWVLVDEAQDTNATRREMAFRMLFEGKPCSTCKGGTIQGNVNDGGDCSDCLNTRIEHDSEGRMVAVGDPHQAIYGFTGADHNGLWNIRDRAGAVQLPLSVSWRCSKAVVAHAQKLVSHIHANPKAPEGSVLEIPFDEHFLSRLQPGDAVLCRLNRPNVAVALGLLRLGKSARIEGRDLGAKLLAHAKRAAPDRPGLVDLSRALEQYLEAETNALLKRNREASVPYLEDEVDALHLLIDRCIEAGQDSFFQLEQLVDELFVSDGHKMHCILLCSVHKAKGLEWPRVYLLGRSDYMPFFRATQKWELDQERNLIYVAITRAKMDLIEVTGVESALSQGLHRKKQPSAAVRKDIELRGTDSAYHPGNL